MTLPPLDVRELVGLVREARRATPADRPVHVSGPGSRALVAALAEGGRSGLVREGTGDGAAVLVRVLAGPPTEEDVSVLRGATRELVPAVVVQTAGWKGPVPYVGASDVVDAPAGLPVEQIARAIAAAAGDDGVALAAGLPVLASPVRAACIARAAGTAALVAATPVGGDAHLPVLALAQTRMLGALRRTQGIDLAGADGPALARAVGPEIVLPLGAGLVARELVRRLPRGGAPLRAVVAAGVTLGLGVLATRLSAPARRSRPG